MAEYRDDGAYPDNAGLRPGDPGYRATTTDPTYRTTGDTVVVERRGNGFARTLAILALIALVIVGILFATGFWKLNGTGGSMPHVSVQGGSMPKVGIQSDKIVVGTEQKTVDVPKIETKKAEVKVPVIGVEKKDAQ